MDPSDLASDRLMDSDDENDIAQRELFELESAIKQGKANQKHPIKDKDIIEEKNPHGEEDVF